MRVAFVSVTRVGITTNCEKCKLSIHLTQEVRTCMFNLSKLRLKSPRTMVSKESACDLSRQHLKRGIRSTLNDGGL